MKKFALIALVLAVAAVAVQASTVTLGIKTTTGGIWKLYAVVSSDCNGLASFDVSFGGGSFASVAGSTNKAPKGYDAVIGDQMGFKMFNANGVIAAGAVANITGGQATAYGDVSNADKDAMVLKNVGISAGSYVYYDPALEMNVTACVWTQPVLIAQGRFTGSGGFLVGAAAGNVLNTGWTGPGNSGVATFVEQQGGSFPFPASMGGAGASEFVPEPATLSLLVVGGIAAIRRRR